jgi:hypothetical protein
MRKHSDLRRIQKLRDVIPRIAYQFTWPGSRRRVELLSALEMPALSVLFRQEQLGRL